MADEDQDRDGTTAAIRSPRHRHQDSSDGVDSISSLPDEILYIILSSLPTKVSISTSILSKRWRHVWSDTPSLNFDWHNYNLEADSINKILDCYTAPKIMDFKLGTGLGDDVNPYISRWIEFTMSRNVENMSLYFDLATSHKYTIPALFYISSSLKQLTVVAFNVEMIVPLSSASWTSLKKLFLRYCDNLSDESLTNILSGCPILETLALYRCCCLKVLDLSKSQRLRTLKIVRDSCFEGPKDIVAPHIHCLILSVPPLGPCNLVDVSSLTEARLDFGFYSHEAFCVGFLQPIVQNMVEKLQNVEKVTFGENFLRILSLAELYRVPLPMFKFKALTLETMISQYVISGIVRLLQNSPELRKLTVLIKDGCIIPNGFIDYYYLYKLSKSYLFCSSEARVFENIIRGNVESWHMALFMELVLKNTKTLEKMVVRLRGYLEGRGFEELLEMVPMLSHNHNNVSIVLSSADSSQTF